MKIKGFLKSGAIGGILLLLCVFISMFIANFSLGDRFPNLLSCKIGFENNAIGLRYSVLAWINDGLMAIFFLLIGLEIKREIVEGELSSFRQAALPVFAALGGVIVPALIYASINQLSPYINGWGIPMATDIAFALAVLSLLGNRVPASLKIFLAALAIVDDLMAILVIAVFYSSKIDVHNLLYAAGLFGLILLFNRFKVKSLAFYLIPGLFIWYFIHHSGIHATIAGVLIAIAIPVKTDSGITPLKKLEHWLTRPVNFLIMPLFALVNTNIVLGGDMVDGLKTTMGIGIITGLFLGKPLGISLLSYIAVKLGWAKLPSASNWKHIIGLGFLGGIGFTMSIFIALLSFPDIAVQQESKFAVLVASVASGVVGYVFLRIINRR